MESIDLDTASKRTKGFILSYNCILLNHRHHEEYGEEEDYNDSYLWHQNVCALTHLHNLIEVCREQDKIIEPPDWLLVIVGMVLMYVASLIGSTDLWHAIFNGMMQ